MQVLLRVRGTLRWCPVKFEPLPSRGSCQSIFVRKRTDDVAAARHGRNRPRSHDTTATDQRMVQLENAKADALFWRDLAEMHGETIAGHKALIQTVPKAIAP